MLSVKVCYLEELLIGCSMLFFFEQSPSMFDSKLNMV